ncbi:MAG: hypothetical protein FWD75_08240, partial [Propionibacteriaceae bacterium]|nr:hypothetical protein [Propionibacteriaceae bacterium]
TLGAAGPVVGAIMIGALVANTAIEVNDMVADATGHNFIQDTICSGNAACYTAVEIGGAALGMVGPTGAAGAAKAATAAAEAEKAAKTAAEAEKAAEEAQKAAEAAADARRMAETAGTAVEGTPQYVYRGGTRSTVNMTPRPGIDDVGDNPGLSTWTTPEAAAPNGGNVQVIDTTKLELCEARCDIAPDGHVAITPSDGTTVSDWANTRGSDPPSPQTQDVINAIVGTIKVKN